jgi:hypothetical protein
MTQTIEITIAPSGQATVETKGFAGPTCRDVSRFLEEALGKPTSEQLTAEFHQALAQPTTHEQRL